MHRTERAALLYARARRRARHAERRPTRSRERARSSCRIGRPLAPHRSDCVGHRDEEVGVREEERGRRSGLEAHGCFCVGVREVFALYAYERGPTRASLPAMPDPFQVVPDANGAMCEAKREARYVTRTALRRVGGDGSIGRRDALREGRRAAPVPRDARPAPTDAPAVPRHAAPEPPDAPAVRRHAPLELPDALPIRGDAPRLGSNAVRRRRRRSRRVRRSSPASCGALPSIGHAAAEPRTCRPIPRERKRAGREQVGARDDAPRTRRDAQREARDTQRGEGDAPTTSRLPVDARRVPFPTGGRPSPLPPGPGHSDRQRPAQSSSSHSTSTYRRAPLERLGSMAPGPATPTAAPRSAYRSAAGCSGIANPGAPRSWVRRADRVAVSS
jgi:hypothetical protein